MSESNKDDIAIATTTAGGSWLDASMSNNNSTLKSRPKRNVTGVLKDHRHDNSSVFDTTNLLQQNELYSEKRIGQMQKEKREMIARNLEENKEKIELSQKLLLCEREVTTLKTKLTKATLENERLERKMMKASSLSSSTTTVKSINIDEMNY